MAPSLGEFVPLPSLKRAICPRVVPLASLVVALASPRCPGSGRLTLDVGCSSRDVHVAEGRRASSSRAALLALRQNPIGWTGSDPFAALRPSIGVQLWAPSGESMLRFLSYRPTLVRIANCIAVRIPSAPPGSPPKRAKAIGWLNPATFPEVNRAGDVSGRGTAVSAGRSGSRATKVSGRKIPFPKLVFERARRICPGGGRA